MPQFFERLVPFTWQFCTAVTVEFLLIILLAVLIRRRRKKTDKPAFGPKGTEAVISPRDLRNIWKKFLKEIPDEFRYSVRMNSPFVVFGDAGAGKSGLIDKYTDWQAMVARFFPSYTVDPLMQVYVGSRSWFQEIPASLLGNTSVSVRKALIKMWKPLFRKREPVILMALDAAVLQNGSAEALRRHAQNVRGKINIISRITGKPGKVKIVLTRMDMVEGYTEFMGFLDQNGILFGPGIMGEDGTPDFNGCIEGCRQHLSRALVSVPAEEYVKILSFYEKLPGIVRCLTSFTNTVLKPDYTSRKPDISGLYLASARGDAAGVNNPFAVDLLPDEVKRYRPWAKHRLAAGLVVLAGVSLFGGMFLYQKAVVERGEELLARLEINPPQANDDAPQQMLARAVASVGSERVFAYFPLFFADRFRANRLGAVRFLQEAYILKELKKAVAEEGDVPVALNLMALGGATKHNSLGKVISENIAVCAKKLNFSRKLIENYIRLNEDVAGITAQMNELPWGRPVSLSYDPREWIFYFNELERNFKRKFASQRLMKQMISGAEKLLWNIRMLEELDLTIELSELLIKELGINPGKAWLRSAQITELRQKPLEEFLTFISRTSLSCPAARDRDLLAFIGNLSDMEKEESIKGAFRFAIAGKGYAFSKGRWEELANSSIISLYVMEFQRVNKKSRGGIFFNASETDMERYRERDPSRMRRVEWRFTREAFQKKVKPAINDISPGKGDNKASGNRPFRLTGFVDKLPIPKGEKKAFLNHVFRQFRIYSREYAKRYRAYYGRNMNSSGAESKEGLLYLLERIQLPTSLINECFRYIADNTDLSIESITEFDPLEKELKPFRFIRRLDKDDENPAGLARYRFMMQRMQEDLSREGKSVPVEEEKNRNKFADSLTPHARLALKVFMGEKESYLDQVNTWLDKNKILNEWRSPFREPVWRASEIGMKELETAVADAWEEGYRRSILPLRLKFPFDRNADEAATPDEVRRLLHPDEEVQTRFMEILSLVAVKGEDGTWQERIPRKGKVRLSERMLARANTMDRTLSILWDEKFLPRPMVVHVKPNPLPAAKKKKPVAALSYLKSGESSAFGFNQYPTWQKLHVAWWKAQRSVVGLEFLNTGNNRKLFKNITVPDVHWSFHHLLKKALESKGNEYRWRLGPGPEVGEEHEVGFITRDDPWGNLLLAP